jgi:selenocysteine-specific elongation factor
MVGTNLVAQSDDAFHLPGHSASLPKAWQADSAKLWEMVETAGLQPPTRDELEALSANGKSILNFWVSSGKAVTLGDGIILPVDAFHSARQKVIEALSDGKSLAAGQLREVLGTTRKYAVPILERLDREGITRRIGDERILCNAQDVDPASTTPS